MTILYPENEIERLDALRATGIMHTGSSPEFDAIVKLAASIFDAPMAAISFIEDDFQWFKAHYGFDAEQTSRKASFNKYTILQDEALVVNDATKDTRFCDSPLVTQEPHVRFLASVPISLDGRTNIAALCVSDIEPRSVSKAQIDQLRMLADVVAALVRAHQAANEAKTLEKDARQRGKLLTQTERISKIGAWSLDTKTQKVHWSAQTMAIHELEGSVPLNLDQALMYYPEYEQERLAECVTICLEQGIPYELECNFITALGNKRRALMMGELDHSEDNSRCLIGTVKDITDEYENAQKLWQAAHIDALTGIANRFSFHREIDSLLDRSGDHEASFKMLLIDLDGFKDINDIFGHLAGDEVLRTIAKRIENTIPENAFCARLGGDEFAVLLDIENATLTPEELACSLLEIIKLGIIYKQHELNVGASIGISLANHKAQSRDEFQHQADLALYHVKRNGRGACKTYDSTLTDAFEEKQNALNLAKKALDEGRLLPHYQPIFDLKTRRIKGVEALARIQSEDGSIIGPANFVQALHEPKTAAAIDETIFEKALNDFGKWRNDGHEIDFISLNASSLCFQSMAYVDRIIDALDRHKLSPCCLKIEVVENIFLDEGVSIISQVLERLSSIGVTIALDDFGTGYASLSHLRDHPVDCIKIDQSFVSGLGQDVGNTAIVHALVALGKALDLDIIAEGIETEGQLDYMTAVGCDYGQGYYFSKPISAEQITEYFNQPAPSRFVGAG